MKKLILFIALGCSNPKNSQAEMEQASPRKNASDSPLPNSNPENKVEGELDKNKKDSDETKQQLLKEAKQAELSRVKELGSTAETKEFYKERREAEAKKEEEEEEAKAEAKAKKEEAEAEAKAKKEEEEKG